MKLPSREKQLVAEEKAERDRLREQGLLTPVYVWREYRPDQLMLRAMERAKELYSWPSRR